MKTQGKDRLRPVIQKTKEKSGGPGFFLKDEPYSTPTPLALMYRDHSGDEWYVAEFSTTGMVRRVTSIGERSGLSLDKNGRIKEVQQ
jgi:hypothetical protein